MSQKHYLAFAEILRNGDFGPVPYEASARRLALAQAFAVFCAEDNPHFNRFKFIQAVMRNDR